MSLLDRVQRTSVISMRIDNRDLATLLVFFRQDVKNPAPTAKGGVAAKAIKEFVQLIIANKLVEPVKTFDDALDILTTAGLGSGVRPGAIASYLQEMNVEALKERQTVSLETETETKTRIAILAEQIKGDLKCEKP
jgi:hypothetical protein